MTTTSDAHGDRETEAAIRKRVAEEIREAMQAVKDTPLPTDVFEGGYRYGWLVGCGHALRIIERGTGVAGKGGK